MQCFDKYDGSLLVDNASEPSLAEIPSQRGAIHVDLAASVSFEFAIKQNKNALETTLYLELSFKIPIPSRDPGSQAVDASQMTPKRLTFGPLTIEDAASSKLHDIVPVIDTCEGPVTTMVTFTPSPPPPRHAATAAHTG
jgi:hypothetical protein